MNASLPMTLICAALLASSAAAQTPAEVVPAPVPGATEAPATVDDSGGELKTLVLDLKRDAAVDAAAVRVMNELITFEIGSKAGRRVLGMSDLRSILDAEAAKATMDCNAESCLAELAGAVDADRVIYGSVQKVGRGYFVLITEIDARTVKPVGRAQRRILDPSPERLTSEVPGIVDELMRGGSSLAKTGVLVVTADALVEVLVDGRGVGAAPAIVENAPSGMVEVEIYVGDEALVVEVPVYPARVTTVSARLNALTGDTTPEQADAAFWNAVWAGAAGGLAVACGAACCAAAPLCAAFGGGLVGLAAGLSQVPTLCGTFNAGAIIWFVAQAVLGLGMMGGGAAGIATAPFLLESDIQQAHVIEVKPPEGEGEPETIRLDVKTGEPLSAGLAPPSPSMVMRY